MKRSEHAPAWRKSSYSGGSSGECLEVDDAHPTGVPVRDSKHATGPVVVFGHAAWTAFAAAVRSSPLNQARRPPCR
ncbi:DUF397 domain-containing protein [Streptomyces sp. NPDC002187]|uniref:DUF397 domain-containing protein n=1 Tax=Streptomyces sp. NPDC002187 TaxID=3364637 RepID=UPI0036930F8C